MPNVLPVIQIVSVGHIWAASLRPARSSRALEGSRSSANCGLAGLERTPCRRWGRYRRGRFVPRACSRVPSPGFCLSPTSVRLGELAGGSISCPRTRQPPGAGAGSSRHPTCLARVAGPDDRRDHDGRADPCHRLRRLAVVGRAAEAARRDRVRDPVREHRLGITVGFHRLFTHRSFKTGRAVRAAIGILGSAAIEVPVDLLGRRPSQAPCVRRPAGRSAQPARRPRRWLHGALRGSCTRTGWLFVHDQRGARDRYAPICSPTPPCASSTAGSRVGRWAASLRPSSSATRSGAAWKRA